MYVVPLPDFEGVRAEVRANNVTFLAWFPIKDHCSLNNSQWWEASVTVKKNITTLTVSLAVHNCLLSCELDATDVRNESWCGLKLQTLELFGRGKSKWSEQRPHESCGIETLPTQLSPLTRLSCNNSHPNNAASPPHPNTEQQPTPQEKQGPSSSTSESQSQDNEGLKHIPWVVSVVVVVVVIMIVVVVVLLMRRRRGQREMEERSHKTHSSQEVYVIRNSIYESFDQYRQHLSGPGQGNAPPDTQR